MSNVIFCHYGVIYKLCIVYSFISSINDQHSSGIELSEFGVLDLFAICDLVFAILFPFGSQA